MKKTKGFDPNNNVKIDVTENMIEIGIEDIIARYKRSGQVDSEYVRLMSNEALISLLYNIATNIFDVYGYSEIPFSQYGYGKKHTPIKILHRIRYVELDKIKDLLCQ